MKKLAALCIALIGMVSLTSCMNANANVPDTEDNKTNEVLWSNSWEENVKPETFTISLKDLKKDDEYVVCFTGTKINQATIEITFESELVQEREKPLR